MRSLLFACAVSTVACFGPVITSVYAQATADVVFENGNLTVESAGAEHVFAIEIADSFEETSQGLMFRESIPKDYGMLFDFGTPREPQMWMKNTLIPLDMLFLDENGVIVAIAENAQPHSLRRISPGMPVKAVFEVNGGLTTELEIAPGDIIRHEIFNNLDEDA